MGAVRHSFLNQQLNAANAGDSREALQADTIFPARNPAFPWGAEHIGQLPSMAPICVQRENVEQLPKATAKCTGARCLLR